MKTVEIIIFSLVFSIQPSECFPCYMIVQNFEFFKWLHVRVIRFAFCLCIKLFLLLLVYSYIIFTFCYQGLPQAQLILNYTMKVINLIITFNGS